MSRLSITQDVLGADPGGQGAVIRLGSDRSIVAQCRFKKLTRSQWKDELLFATNVIEPNPCEREYRTPRAYLEINHAFGNDHVNTAFTHGRNYERLVAIFEDTGVEIIYVDCQKWLRFHRLADKMDRDVRMREYVKKAKLLFPGYKPITQDNAAALLIAYYGWNQEFGF